MKYNYKDPLENGYVKIKVGKHQHNKVFKYEKRTLIKDLMCKTEYFYKDHHVLLHKSQLNIFGKVLAVLAFPIFLIIEGIANIKELSLEYKKLLFPKKFGGFVRDIVEEPHNVSILIGEK